MQGPKQLKPETCPKAETNTVDISNFKLGMEILQATVRKGLGEYIYCSKGRRDEKKFD